MSVSITPDEITGLPDITRPNYTMNTSVSASCSVQSPNQCAITNVNATVQGNQPNLVITPGTTSVSITGTLADPFSDFFTYVEQGDTDLNSTPITVESTDNMPDDKVFYNLDQDGRNYVSEFFDITVQWESGPLGNMTAQTPATFTLELKIYNEWEGIRSFVSNYYN